MPPFNKLPKEGELPFLNRSKVHQFIPKLTFIEIEKKFEKHFKN